jgi:hypothetical protein
MRVGVNYPWFDYGWDFGLGPPVWRGPRATPRWYDEIAQHLMQLYNCGIRIVRWFVLADGLTYGTGDQAPRLDSASAVWRFNPPPVESDILDHFKELLVRFTLFNEGRQDLIQLFPVLIDFHFCDPGMPILDVDPADPNLSVPSTDWIKQGRADAIADPATRLMFLDLVLEPLLQVSQQYGDVIYAWELINEPEWVTRQWHGSRQDHPIEEEAMHDFLVEGTDRVRRAGFKATIGFARVETLLASGITADVNQFHHYPGGTRVLPPQLFDSRFPAIVGEFATAANDVWPELGLQRQTVFNRLLRAEAQDYPVAIPWSFLARDRHTAWSRSVERDVLAFTERQP